LSVGIIRVRFKGWARVVRVSYILVQRGAGSGRLGGKVIVSPQNCLSRIRNQMKFSLLVVVSRVAILVFVKTFVKRYLKICCAADTLGNGISCYYVWNSVGACVCMCVKWRTHTHTQTPRRKENAAWKTLWRLEWKFIWLWIQLDFVFLFHLRSF
jgi:hypothetical protein